jgi:hypothetical protein
MTLCRENQRYYLSRYLSRPDGRPPTHWHTVLRQQEWAQTSSVRRVLKTGQNTQFAHWIPHVIWFIRI